MTIDEILRAYDGGVLTMSELCGHILPVLATVPPETVRARLRAEEGRVEAFERWVDAISDGAEILAGSRPVSLSDDVRAAVERFRDHARSMHYAELAERMRPWMSAQHEGEPALDVDQIEPFVWTDIEAMLGEAA